MATPTRRSTSSRSSPWPTRSDKKSCHTVVGEGPSSGRNLQDAGSAISKNLDAEIQNNRACTDTI